MELTNHCRRVHKDQRIKIYYWAKRLDAEECIIHTDGTVSLYCKDGCICEHYRPSERELNGK